MKTNKIQTAKILLVEDDPNLSMVIKDYLEMLNFNTTLCKDGEEGLTEFTNGKYDLVILDVMQTQKNYQMIGKK